MTRRILISGASGALGSFLIRFLAPRVASDTQLVGMFRSENSYARFRAEWMPDHGDAIVPLFCDLTKPADIAAAAGALADVHHTVGIHCAADVSWSKAFKVVSPLNVEGSLAFARLVQSNTRRASLVYISSAYTSRDSDSHANAYEQTKAMADALLRSTYPDLPMTTVSCSLIAGASTDGAIGRFNGVYPLMRLMATAGTPVIVSEKSYALDIVPVDWVVEELAYLLERHWDGSALPDEVVLAASDERLGIQRLNDVVHERASQVRLECNVPQLPKVAILSPRQYAFLQRSSGSWGYQHLLDHLERYNTFFREYVEHSKVDKVRLRQHAQNAPPAIEHYLPRLVDFWLAKNRPRVATADVPTWQDILSPRASASP